MTIFEVLSAIRDKIKKRLPIILIISLILAIVVAIFIRQLPTKYIAKSKIFPLSANSARGSSSPIGQLQQQFGLQPEGSNEVYDIQELINSKRLSFKVVNSKPLNKKYNTLYKWLISDHNSELGWFEDAIELSKKKKDSVHNLILGRNVLLSRVGIETSENGYTTVSVESFEKELAKEVNENILLALSNFYIDFVTEKPRNDLQVIRQMRDSLSIELSSISRAMAGVQDKSAYATKAYVGLPMIKLQRKQEEVRSLYATTLTALQNARFKLLSESPIFQILDYPGEPYSVVKPDWKPKAAITFAISFILLSLWFTRRIFGRLIIEELKKA